VILTQCLGEAPFQVCPLIEWTLSLVFVVCSPVKWDCSRSYGRLWSND
jgi:hypothetical protein